MRIDDEPAEFLRCGVAAVVATRDEQLRPAIGRGWAPRSSDGGSLLTLCVEAPPASPMRANLTGNGVTAATFSLPTTYRTVQVKGAAIDVREPTREELDAGAAHCDAFSVEAEAGAPAARRATAARLEAADGDAVSNLARARVMQAAVRGTSGDPATAIPLPGLEHARSVAAVPLVARNEVAGALYLESDRTGTFGPHASCGC